jgi:hypothetical protein
VLHPTRYPTLDSSEGEGHEPSPVVIPDLAATLGSEWEVLLRDTLGEFVIKLYLDQAMPEDAARRRADGWDGDTFLVWEREDGGRLMVWRSLWESSAEAEEFEQGLRLVLPQRYVPVRPIEPPRGISGTWWETDSGTIHLRRAGRYVLLARAPDTETAADAAEALP